MERELVRLFELAEAYDNANDYWHFRKISPHLYRLWEAAEINLDQVLTSYLMRDSDKLIKSDTGKVAVNHKNPEHQNSGVVSA